MFDGDRPRNLLVISIDTLRRDALARYGGGPGSETLDRLLAEGVALDQHTQCSDWTFPSTTCTQAGRYLETLGVVPTIAEANAPLPDLPAGLAGVLHDQGFATLMASASVYLTSARNNAQGFDRDVQPDDRHVLGVWSAGRDMLRDALASGADRWMLQLHVVEPHEPYTPPQSYLSGLDDLPPDPWGLGDGTSAYDVFDDWAQLSAEDQALLVALERVRYLGEVAFLDDQLDTVLSELDAEGWLDDTLVMLWSDHGESFFEHGHATHAWTLHAQENDGVAGFWAENLRPVAWGEPTTAVDLAPTALEALGVPIPDDFDGEVVGTADPHRPRFAVVSGRAGVQQAVVQDHEKLLYDWSGRVYLYDRSADPGELEDRAADRPERVRALYELLEPRTAQLGSLLPDAPRPPDGL